MGKGQAEIVQEELRQNPDFEAFHMIPDYSGILRVLHLQKINR
jgi:hypothetical protein